MNFINAAIDIRYLLDRGYPLKGVIGFVCNHYGFDEESRRLLQRIILPREVSENRRAKFLPCDSIEGSTILIDGYNIIIGMESILDKKAFVCDDGVIRDIKGAFRNYKTSKSTETVIELILQFLKENNPDYVCFLLDSQISKSGLLARTLRLKISDFGLKGEAITSKHVDHDLKNSIHIVASSDGAIIDAAGKAVNFLYCMISRFKHLESGVVRELSDIPKTRLKGKSNE